MNERSSVYALNESVFTCGQDEFETALEAMTTLRKASIEYDAKSRFGSLVILTAEHTKESALGVLRERKAQEYIDEIFGQILMPKEVRFGDKQQLIERLKEQQKRQSDPIDFDKIGDEAERISLIHNQMNYALATAFVCAVRAGAFKGDKETAFGILAKILQGLEVPPLALELNDHYRELNPKEAN